MTVHINPFVLLHVIACATLADAGEFRSLFDGKSLKGWSGDPTRWSVKDGAIIGSTRPKGIRENTFLIADGRFGDFVLRVKFKCLRGASGIQIRSRVYGKPLEFRVKGYQADIGGADLGTFYEEKGRGTLAASNFKKLKPFVKEKGWNTYEIKAVGGRFELRVNGQVTSRYTEKKITPPKTGVIALQLQAGGPMEIHFKDIEIRDIKSDSRRSKSR